MPTHDDFRRPVISQTCGWVRRTFLLLFVVLTYTSRSPGISVPCALDHIIRDLGDSNGVQAACVSAYTHMYYVYMCSCYCKWLCAEFNSRLPRFNPLYCDDGKVISNGS